MEWGRVGQGLGRVGGVMVSKGRVGRYGVFGVVWGCFHGAYYFVLGFI